MHDRKQGGIGNDEEESSKGSEKGDAKYCSNGASCDVTIEQLVKPRPNALDFSLYIARQMSSIVECCRERVAKRSRLFTRLGT